MNEDLKDIREEGNYKWIKVKRYEMDESASWEDRYRQLEAHHMAETTFLIGKCRELAERLNKAFRMMNKMAND